MVAFLLLPLYRSSSWSCVALMKLQTSRLYSHTLTECRTFELCGTRKWVCCVNNVCVCLCVWERVNNATLDAAFFQWREIYRDKLIISLYICIVGKGDCCGQNLGGLQRWRGWVHHFNVNCDLFNQHSVQVDNVEQGEPQPQFMSLVQNLLSDPNERSNFFQVQFCRMI